MFVQKKENTYIFANCIAHIPERANVDRQRLVVMLHELGEIQQGLQQTIVTREMSRIILVPTIISGVRCVQSIMAYACRVAWAGKTVDK